MKIVIDSSVFCRDFYLKGTAFSAFLDSHDRISAIICVPQLVLDEVVNKYNEQLTELLLKYEKIVGRITKHVNKRLAVDPLSDAILNNELKYEDFLIGRLSEVGAEILPYPEIKLEEMVKYDLSRKKPFGKGKQGYRDFLIWRSIVDLLERDPFSRGPVYQTEPGKVAFITNDVEDFSDRESLHPDLIRDVKSRGIDINRFSIYFSLEDFNKKVLIPDLEPLEELKTRLLDKESKYFDIYEWIKTGLLELMGQLNLGPVVFGLEDDIGTTWPVSVNEIIDTEIIDVHLLESGDKLVSGSTELNVKVSASFDWEDYYNSADLRELLGEFENPFVEISGDYDTKIKAWFTFILMESPEGPKILGSDLDAIEGEGFAIDFGSALKHGYYIP